MIEALCEHCSGSGVLNIITAWEGLGDWDDTPYVTPCHCPQGKLWIEVGLVF